MLLFYLFTPIIKIVINNSKLSDLKYLLILWFILASVLPTFMNFEQSIKFSNFNQYIVMHMGYACIIYGILGYYMTQRILATKYYLFTFILGFLFTFISTDLLCLSKNEISIVFLGGVSPSVIFMAYGLFGTVLSTDFKIYYLKIVENIAMASFCIFLVHDMFLKVLYLKIIKLSQLPDIVNVPIYIFIIFVPSYIIYKILKKIKYVNKYLI